MLIKSFFFFPKDVFALLILKFLILMLSSVLISVCSANFSIPFYCDFIKTSTTGCDDFIEVTCVNNIFD